MSKEIPYLDRSHDKEILEYVAKNGKLPPDQILSAGIIGSDIEESDKYLLIGFSLTGDNLYQTGESLIANAKMLFAQKRRKIRDILKTLDYVLGTAEEIGSQLIEFEHSYAQKFQDMLTRIYSIRNPLERISQLHPEATLAEAAKEDARISDNVEQSYQRQYTQLSQLAEILLANNPEFKEKISERLLTDCFINVPVVVPEQLHKKDLPSDMEIPKKIISENS
jgi:hypothetical protein